MSGFLFERIAIIGLGLIGSSVARALRQTEGVVRLIATYDRDPEVLTAARELGLADLVTDDIGTAIADADLVMVATPMSAYAGLAPLIAQHVKPGAVITDVGSVKVTVLRDLAPHLPKGVWLVPGHPIAGTEKSGPRNGLVDMFRGRWCILTPIPDTPRAIIDSVAALWRSLGSDIAEMDAVHHDKVLAITSHLPHLIAFTIVGTAVDLEESLQSEVIKYSASGFRDFTRIAASDPTMWRDIFLNNREAVLEMLQRLTEDLTALQRAIRRGEGDFLFERFKAAQAIRRGVIAAHQA